MPRAVAVSVICALKATSHRAVCKLDFAVLHRRRFLGGPGVQSLQSLVIVVFCGSDPTKISLEINLLSAESTLVAAL